MKKLFRRDVLSWIDGGAEAAAVRAGRARDHAAQAMGLAQRGELRFAEPWLHGLVDRVASLPMTDESAPEAALRSIRADVRSRPRDVSEPWPFAAVSRTVLPLPRGARPGFVRFLPLGPERCVVAVQGFRPITGGVGAPRFMSHHRLFAMDGHDRGLREVFSFELREDAAIQVHVLHDGQGVLVLVGDRLVEVHADGSFDELCQLERPQGSDEPLVVRAAATLGDDLVLCVDDGDEDCGLFRYDRAGRVEQHLGPAGHQIGGLIADRGDLWVSELLTVRCLPLDDRNAPIERDLRPFFDDVPFTPTESVAVLGDVLLVSNGRKLLRVGRDLGDVLDEHIPPVECRSLHVIGGEVVCSFMDPARGALVVDVWRPVSPSDFGGP